MERKSLEINEASRVKIFFATIPKFHCTELKSTYTQNFLRT